MQEQVFLIMSKNGCQVAEHDITNIDFKELLELVEIQREFGRTCSIKRVFVNNKEVLNET